MSTTVLSVQMGPSSLDLVTQMESKRCRELRTRRRYHLLERRTLTNLLMVPDGSHVRFATRDSLDLVKEILPLIQVSDCITDVTNMID